MWKKSDTGQWVCELDPEQINGLQWEIDKYNESVKSHPESAVHCLPSLANWLAVDHLRHMGPDEVREAAWYIFEHGGREIAELIADTFPQYWPPAE